MRPKFEFRGLTRFAAAMTKLKRLKSVTGEEEIPLKKALGRISAAAVKAPFFLPAADNAAVDGYAFNAAHFVRSSRLRLGGELSMGKPPPKLPDGSTARSVATGSIIPPPLDTVVMEEHCLLCRGKEGELYLTRPRRPYKKGQNIRRRGEDLKKGELAFASGRVLRPQELAMAAALGIRRLKVKKRLRVAVISSGNELQSAGRAPKAGKLFDANRPSLIALLEAANWQAIDCGIVKDDKKAVIRLLKKVVKKTDAALISGGSSSARQDIVAAAIAEIGQFRFQKCAVKPGRPFAFAEVEGIPIFNLPGNAVAANVIFMMMVKSALLRLSGAKAEEPPRFSVVADFAMAKKAGRREWLRGRVSNYGGEMMVRKEKSGAGILSSLVRANGLIELDEEITEIKKGERVKFIPFAAI